LIGVLLVWGSLPTSGLAQWESARLQPLSPAAQARGGIQLLRKGQAEQARTFLDEAYAAHPSLVLPEHGAVAYWAGEAYAQTGDSAKARSAWRDGVRLLQERDTFDVRLADAYLRSLNRTQLRNQRLQAVEAYMGLMSRVGHDSSEARQELFQRRLAQIVPLMTDDVFAQVIEGKRGKKPSTWTFRAGAGDSLQAWWRGLDPYPDTPENERLEEHLTRLVHARQSFTCQEKTSGFDARGTVYLRFGAPYKRRDLSYKDGEFFREVVRFGVPIPPSSFPKSEIWLYPGLSDFGYYLFAEGEGSDCFREARVNDLLPSTLTMSRGNTERGLNIAYSSLMAMRAIYRELALYHISFSGRYSEIADYATYQEMKATEAKMDQMVGRESGGGGEQQVTVGAGVGMTRTITTNPVIGMGPPTQFVTRMVSRARQEDQYAEKRRENEMPRQYTALHDNVPELPVAVRTARFLDEDGTTRTEVYWGLLATAARLQPDEEDEEPAPSMIRFSATQHNKDRTQVQRRNRRHKLPAEPEAVRPVLIPNPVAFTGISSLHHLSLQWTQHRLWQGENGAIAGLGPKRRFTTAQSDSLSPLRTSGPEPEMSDLKVLSLPDTTAEMLTQPEEYAYPYPFTSITPGTPLLLSFEVYHLAFGEDDRTQYTISYEVEGETRRGWTRLFRGQDTQQTTTEMTMQGSERRTKERILLDLSRLRRDEPQDVRVTVRVTDEVTGMSVTRTLDFVLRPSENS
jgi:GWxTD domain-containing protein